MSSIFQNIIVPEMSRLEWIRDLAFLSDLSTHFDILNVKLQGKNQDIVTMFDSVKAFMAKLQFWIQQLGQSNMIHFPSVASLEEAPTDPCLTYYQNILKRLHQTMEDRFIELKEMEKDIRLYVNPIKFEVAEAPESLQLELIDLHNNTVIVCSEKTDLDLFKTLAPDDYPNIRNFAMRIACMFGSTYSCEQLFSKMNHVKSKSRSRITDFHLVSVLRLSCSTVMPNLDKLIMTKHWRRSRDRSN